MIQSMCKYILLSSCLGSQLANLAHHTHALQHGAEAHVVIIEGSLLPGLCPNQAGKLER